MSYKRYVFSDVHIGTNHKVNWYQKSVHGPLLQAAMDYIIQQGKAVDGVDFAGDLFDLWAYPSNEATPAFSDVIAANPEVFGEGGLVPRLLDAVGGQCVWMPGNHDMTVQPSELATIRGASGKALLPAAFSSKEYVCQHGNEFCYFNTPDVFRMGRFSAPLGELPFGYFMTRYASDVVVKMIEKEGKNNYAELSQSPETLIKSTFKKRIVKVIEDAIMSGGDLNKALLMMLVDVMKVPISDVQVDGDALNYYEVFQRYDGTFGRWWDTYSFTLLGEAVYGDLFGDIDWLGEELREKHHLVVMGHTHVPKYMSNKKKTRTYVNNGFFCPTLAEMKKGIRPTFTEITVDDGGGATAKILEVASDGKVKEWSAKAVRAPMSKAERRSFDEAMKKLYDKLAEQRGKAPQPAQTKPKAAPAGKAPTSKASTSKAPTSKASTSKASAGKAPTSKASTSKAPAGKPARKR